ncbi:MAG: hypothetical protein ACFFCQ_05080 [Promethearchaeota archaeon]
MSDPITKEEVHQYVKKALRTFVEKIGSRISHLEGEINKFNEKLIKLEKLNDRIAALESISTEKKEVSKTFPAPQIQKVRPVPKIITAIDTSTEIPPTESTSISKPVLKTPVLSIKERERPEKKEREKDELLKALKVIEEL